MVYISKKRGIKDFFKTRNMKYYIAFLVLFLAVIAAIIFVSRRIKQPSDTQPDSTLADDESVTETDSETTASSRGLYRININLATHMIAAYAYDETDGSYSDKPSRYMTAGISSVLQTGSYSGENGVKAAWFDVADDGFYRYYSDYGSSIIFHSALYDTSGDKNSLMTADYNSIGSDTETDGITLQIADAKWIYENCSYQCEFVVYSDADEHIDFEYIAKTNIPDGIRWDPTDTSEDNSVWCPSEIKLLECDDKIEIDTGSVINDILKHVNARDKSDASVISYVYITGKYDLDKAGEYRITLNLVDTFKNHLTRSTTLVVKDKDDETSGEETSDDTSSKPTKPKESEDAKTTTADSHTVTTSAEDKSDSKPAESTTAKPDESRTEPPETTTVPVTESTSEISTSE